MSNTDVSVATSRKLFSNVRRIEVRYSGGGDSGCIDSTTLYGPRRKKLTATPEQEQYIEKRCYDVLDGLPDWYNNEGGEGSIDIDLKQNEMTIEHSVFDASTDSTRWEAEPLSESVQNAVAQLPESVVTVLAELESNNGDFVVGVDARGRRVDIDAAVAEHVRAVLTEWVSSYVIPSDADPSCDDTKHEIVIDLLKSLADVCLEWSTKSSDTEGHCRLFFEDAEGSDD